MIASVLRILSAVLGLVCFSLWVFAPKSVCERPLRYRIGGIDPRFGISRSILQGAVEQAAGLWEKAAGCGLFEFDEESRFAVNLIFDERQEGHVQRKGLQSRINLSDADVRELQDRYQPLKAIYDMRREAYTRDAERLQRQRTVTLDEQHALESDRQRLNDSAHAVNAVVVQMNDAGQKLNSEVALYNVGAGTVFDRAKFTGKSIDIYQVDDPVDLVLVMAHELGHALLIGHVDNPAAIMHHIKGKQPLRPVALTQDDASALKAACRKKIYIDPRRF